MYRNQFRKARKSVTKPAPRKVFWFVREPATQGEDVQIYSFEGCQEHADNEIKQPRTRLFVEGKDDRGPAVKFIATWGDRETVWHPKTEGSYVVILDAAGYATGKRLHMGSVSSPQPTKAAVHRIYLDIVKQSPELVPHLTIAKVPCVFCKDHPTAPGGTRVPVAVESLPEPCELSQVAKFYG